MCTLILAGFSPHALGENLPRLSKAVGDLILRSNGREPEGENRYPAEVRGFWEKRSIPALGAVSVQYLDLLKALRGFTESADRVARSESSERPQNSEEADLLSASRSQVYSVLSLAGENGMVDLASTRVREEILARAQRNLPDYRKVVAADLVKGLTSVLASAFARNMATGIDLLAGQSQVNPNGQNVHEVFRGVFYSPSPKTAARPGSFIEVTSQDFELATLVATDLRDLESRVFTFIARVTQNLEGATPMPIPSSGAEGRLQETLISQLTQLKEELGSEEPTTFLPEDLDWIFLLTNQDKPLRDLALQKFREKMKTARPSQSIVLAAVEFSESLDDAAAEDFFAAKEFNLRSAVERGLNSVEGKFQLTPLDRKLLVALVAAQAEPFHLTERTLKALVKSDAAEDLGRILAFKINCEGLLNPDGEP